MPVHRAMVEFMQKWDNAFDLNDGPPQEDRIPIGEL